MITSFCWRLEIQDGVSFSGGFDLLLSLIWFVLLLANLKSGLWVFYAINSVVGVFRLKAFYEWYQEDGQATRFSLFKTQALSLLGY